MGKAVFSLLVENTAGVLCRISGLFSRRGYNIDSLTVGETENPQYSRMTVVATGDDVTLELIRRQLEKQVEVIDIQLLNSHSTSVNRELVLMKVGVKAEDRQKIINIVDIFRAKIIDIAEKSVIIELTGNSSKVDAFLRLIGEFELIEMARTGTTGLRRGVV